MSDEHDDKWVNRGIWLLVLATPVLLFVADRCNYRSSADEAARQNLERAEQAASAELDQRAREDRERIDNEVADAVGHCEGMGQVPVVIAPTRFDPPDRQKSLRVICLQAPSVAFDTGQIR